MVPSKLSTIKIFGQTEESPFVDPLGIHNPILYAKQWPWGEIATMFIENAAQPLVKLLSCGEQANIPLEVATLVGTNLWQFKTQMNAVNAAQSARPYSFQFYDGAAGTPLYPGTTSNGEIIVPSIFVVGVLATIKSSVHILTITPSMRVVVATTKTARLKIFRVSDDDMRSITEVGDYPIPLSGVPVGAYAPVINVTFDQGAGAWLKGMRIFVGVISPQSGGPAELTLNHYTRPSNDLANTFFDDAFEATATGITSFPFLSTANTNVKPAIVITKAPALYSELFTYNFNTINFGYSQTKLSRFTFSNIKQFQGLPANTTVVAYLPIEFWEDIYPEEFEDIEIVPGEFTRLRNELIREKILSTDYVPAYAHEALKLMMACDSFTVNGIEYIQRAGYIFTKTKLYTLSKGKVTLTERKSIVRNIK